MTKQQIKNKLQEQDAWLKANPNHYDYVVILKEKRRLEQELAEKEREDSG